MQHFHANGSAMPQKKDWTAQLRVCPARHIRNQNTFFQDPIKKIVTTRTGGSPKRHTYLNTQKDEDSFRLPSATVRQVVACPSRHPRDLFALCSGSLREVFECCSGFSEAHPKRTRTTLEGVPNKSRSGVEERPKETRTASEEIDGFLPRFIDTLKAGIKYRCSKDIVLFTQLLRKIDEVSLKYIFRTSGVQYPYLFSTTTPQAQPKDDLRLTQQRPKDDPSASLARPSLRTGYRQGSPKVDTRNTQEAAKDDTRNRSLVYGKGTVSVRGVYQKGTKEVLRRYWRATEDILNACTSVVHQQYSKRRRVVGVEAMKNRAIPFMAIWLCFMLFNLSDAWAQSAETRTAEGQTEIQPLQIGDTIPVELWNLPLQVVNHPDGKDTITLNDYRAKKLIILDFWATWCAPCIESLHKLDSINRNIDEGFVAVPISNEVREKVDRLLNDREILLGSIYDDWMVRKYFNFQSIPHQIWIREDKIYAFTGSRHLRYDLIADVASGLDVSMVMKQDTIDFDVNESFVTLSNGLHDSDALYQSAITKALDMTIGGINIKKNGILIYNSTISGLFGVAYQDVIPMSGRRNRVIIEVDDELNEFFSRPDLSGLAVYDADTLRERWRKNTRFCYNLELANDTDRSQLLQTMQEDIGRFFRMHHRIVAEVEHRETDCLVVVRAGKKKSTGIVGQVQEDNISLADLVNRLSSVNWNLPTPIVSRIEGNMEIKGALPKDFRDMKAIKDLLRQNGLDLVNSKENIPVLIISSIKDESSI